MSDVALILAKKGSKGLPGKNLMIWKKKNTFRTYYYSPKAIKTF